MKNECNSGDYQFAFKPTWFGIVVMVRESEPQESPGTFAYGKWRKATWAEMLWFNEDKLK